MNVLLKKYRWGLDFWGLILFAIIMLPNILYFILVACGVTPELKTGGGVIDIAATVFQVLGVAALIFVVEKKRKIFTFDCPLFALAGLFLIPYYISWGFYFLNHLNSGVILFLAVCPCVSLILYEIERKNWFALLPTSIFAALHIVSAILAVI